MNPQQPLPPVKRPGNPVTAAIGGFTDAGRMMLGKDPVNTETPQMRQAREAREAQEAQAAKAKQAQPAQAKPPPVQAAKPQAPATANLPPVKANQTTPPPVAQQAPAAAKPAVQAQAPAPAESAQPLSSMLAGIPSAITAPVQPLFDMADTAARLIPGADMFSASPQPGQTQQPAAPDAQTATPTAAETPAAFDISAFLPSSQLNGTDFTKSVQDMSASGFWDSMLQFADASKAPAGFSLKDTFDKAKYSPEQRAYLVEAFQDHMSDKVLGLNDQATKLEQAGSTSQASLVREQIKNEAARMSRLVSQQTQSEITPDAMEQLLLQPKDKREWIHGITTDAVANGKSVGQATWDAVKAHPIDAIQQMFSNPQARSMAWSYASNYMTDPNNRTQALLIGGVALIGLMVVANMGMRMMGGLFGGGDED